MQNRLLLLFADSGSALTEIGQALRDAGYTVLPSRYHELGVDALARVAPYVVLVPADHEAAHSPEFRAMAEAIDAKVFAYLRTEEPSRGAAFLPDAHPYPLLEYSGDAKTLAALVDDVFRRELWLFTPLHSQDI